MNHTTNTVDSIRPQDVLELCKWIAADRSNHALKEIESSVVNEVPAIRDWHPDFAFTHLLHFVTEEAGRLPSFDDFARHPIFKDAMYEDIEAQVLKVARLDKAKEPLARNAVRWRIGIAYYSFLKEQYVISLIRSEGINVKQHPLADALFRVDCWVGDTNIDLYVTNSFFRSEKGDKGRKIKSQDLLADAIPPFNNVILACKTRHTFGDVHLPDENDVRDACRKLLSGTS
ncbi:hypothetical protein [Noviherbaspirillum autotrophicum]|nr:hypothetical protein [Noviherbaspirillum autotrophicum]